jgi:hypothetical protein
MKYENSLIMAEGDILMLHGRFSGLGPSAKGIVVDIVRIENGLLADHWDVIEDEVTREKSASGQPMFGEASLLMISHQEICAPGRLWCERPRRGQ